MIYQRKLMEAEKKLKLIYFIHLEAFLLSWIMLYAFFWVIPRRLNFICRRFGTLCLFHLHRRVGMKKLNNVLLSKYMCTLLVSLVTAHDVKPSFVTFFVYTEFRMVNLDIS
jgi:hypothetical protein